MNIVNMTLWFSLSFFHCHSQLPVYKSSIRWRFVYPATLIRDKIIFYKNMFFFLLCSISWSLECKEETKKEFESENQHVVTSFVRLEWRKANANNEIIYANYCSRTYMEFCILTIFHRYLRAKLKRWTTLFLVHTYTRPIPCWFCKMMMPSK